MSGRSLSGVWEGLYDYDLGWANPVPFNAVLTDEAGSLTGEIHEPNTFEKGGGGTLRALVTGLVTGAVVSFVKRYDLRPEPVDRVFYKGLLNATWTAIEGEWTIRAADGGVVLGPFEMRRGEGPSVEIEARARGELELVGAPLDRDVPGLPGPQRTKREPETR